MKNVILMKKDKNLIIGLLRKLEDDVSSDERQEFLFILHYFQRIWRLLPTILNTSIIQY